MTQQNIIYEDLVFRDAQATPALRRVNTEVGALARGVSALKRTFAGTAAAAGIGGFFAVSRAVANVSALYERVRRLTAVTGMAAAEVHGLADAFELTGASDQVADRTITRLAAIGQKAQGAGKEANELRARLRHVGVDMKGGVTSTLLGMSSAVKAGKLGVAEMAKTFKIPIAQSAQLMATLRQGPARLKAIIAETKAGADVVDEAALASFERMEQGKRDLADAFDGLVGTLYKQLLPAATTFVNGLRSGLEQVQPVAEAIGGFLSRHMGIVVGLAKAYLAYMVAAKAVSATMGVNLGGLVKGQLGSVLKFARGPGFVPPGISRAAAMSNLGGGFAQAGQMAAIRMQFAGRTGRLAGAGESVAMGIARWSPTLGRIAASSVSIRQLGMVLGRFGIAGAALSVGVKMFGILKNDIGGHRTRIVALLRDIVDKFKGVGRVLAPVLNLLGKVFGGVITVVAHTLLYVFEGILFVIKGVLTLVQAIAYFIGDLVTTAPWNWGVSMFTSAWRKANAKSEELVSGAGKKRSGGTPTKEGGVYQDFRGSKFTIENKFAEGFDPGRVATAITEGIATAGQRRLQSGFAPLFAIRGGG